MKLRVERDVLADGVSWAARALPSRPSLPVLSGLMLEAVDGSLTISSFDQDVSARVDIAADSECCVQPARDFGRHISKLELDELIGR